MFVIMAMVGFKARKLLSNSSASTTIISPEPNFELLSRLCTSPPTTKVGSIFALDKTVPAMDDVVVLPCVPPTAMLVSFTDINSPNISARLIIGISFCFALIISGFSRGTALE